jgi:hypothetical protein
MCTVYSGQYNEWHTIIGRPDNKLYLSLRKQFDSGHEHVLAAAGLAII